MTLALPSLAAAAAQGEGGVLGVARNLLAEHPIGTVFGLLMFVTLIVLLLTQPGKGKGSGSGCGAGYRDSGGDSGGDGGSGCGGSGCGGCGGA